MKTKENLQTAFAGESQANRKYLAFAKKAEKEGLINVSRLFTAIAEAETIHALKHLEVAGKVGTTLENLETAIEGETHEFTEMYPDFIQTAAEEKQGKAQKSFELANEAEKVHGETFKRLLELVKAGKDEEDKDIFLCPVCGWVGVDPVPERCPICGTIKKAFKKF